MAKRELERKQRSSPAAGFYENITFQNIAREVETGVLL
jgi:hypothetical protein